MKDNSAHDRQQHAPLLGVGSSDQLGPLPRVPACPFAVFDEFGRGADDRVQDYAAALVAAERERCARIVERINGWVGTREIAAEIRGETQVLRA